MNGHSCKIHTNKNTFDISNKGAIDKRKLPTNVILLINICI